ncbi:MAG: HIT family protein [Acidimicrobiales bacterium]|nr:HIT family protein [Acidimicrobiales bacterium]HRW37247.1 HIT family protein [Aquihabitans sp.]
MATLFTRIIDGEIPGRFVWRDDRCVAFLTIAPIAAGHVLVVPRVEVDHWIDLDDDTAAHLMVVARRLGAAQMAAFSPSRIGVIVAGLEVPHTHVHVIPIETEADLDFRRADAGVAPEALDAAAEALRAALRDAGHSEAATA